MTNPIANTEFKIKINGQKLKVRIMEDGEKINRFTLRSNPFFDISNKTKGDEIDFRNSFLEDESCIKKLKESQWFFPNNINKRTDEKPNHFYVYIEVLSPFFSPNPHT